MLRSVAAPTKGGGFKFTVLGRRGDRAWREASDEGIAQDLARSPERLEGVPLLSPKGAA